MEHSICLSELPWLFSLTPCAAQAAFEAATAVLEDACEFEATPAKAAPRNEAADSEELATPTRFFGRRSSITNIDQTPGSSAKKERRKSGATRGKKKMKVTGRIVAQQS